MGNKIESFFRELLRPEPISDAPLSAALLPVYLKCLWARLGSAGPGGAPLRLAVFGAGVHTAWLHETVKDVLPAPRVVALLDDKPSSAQCSPWGLRAVSPESFDCGEADAALVSSDSAAGALEKRCEQLFRGRLAVINPYAELPPGPYFKLWPLYGERK